MGWEWMRCKSVVCGHARARVYSGPVSGVLWLFGQNQKSDRKWVDSQAKLVGGPGYGV